MTRLQIIKKYNSLLVRIEEMPIYDGRGTVDLYQCDKCSRSILTTYKDKGVTPFIIRCEICGGTMPHTRTFRKDEVPAGSTILNWYRPTLKQLLTLTDPLARHVLDGGLILEKK